MEQRLKEHIIGQESAIATVGAGEYQDHSQCRKTQGSSCSAARRCTSCCYQTGEMWLILKSIFVEYCLCARHYYKLFAYPERTKVFLSAAL